MATTRNIVGSIHRRNSKYSPTEILELLNEVHQRCVEQDIDAFLFKNETGMPSYLETQDGVYRYDCPENCRKTSKLAIISGNFNPSYNNFLGERYEDFKWCGQIFYNVPYIFQSDAIPDSDTLATVSFGGEYNPGTTTNKYRHFYWINANQIETLDDELQLPPSVHYEIKEAICDMISEEDFGERTGLVDRVAAMVRRKFSGGSDGRSGEKKINFIFRD
jgi:hypothetical protein